MTEHISPEKLKTFLKGELSGYESVEILIHMEICDECQSRLPQENPPEVINRLLTDEDLTKKSALQESNPEHSEKAKLSPKT